MKLIKQIDFSLMALKFKIRDLHIPPEKVVKESGIKEGMTILDYGCGPGSYSIAAAKLVGSKGVVYAADENKKALNCLRKAAKKWPNILTIQTSCATGLPDSSVDIIFLFDIYHHLQHPEKIMQELHRVLKEKGILSFSDHHIEEAEILNEIAKYGLFELSYKGNKTFNFKKA